MVTHERLTYETPCATEYRARCGFSRLLVSVRAEGWAEVPTCLWCVAARSQLYGRPMVVHVTGRMTSAIAPWQPVP